MFLLSKFTKTSPYRQTMFLLLKFQGLRLYVFNNNFMIKNKVFYYEFTSFCKIICFMNEFMSFCKIIGFTKQIYENKSLSPNHVFTFKI